MIIIIVFIVCIAFVLLFVSSGSDEDKIARIQAKHSPDMTGLGAKIKNWSATQRAGLQETLNRETTGVLTSRTLVDNYDRDRTLKYAQVEDNLRKLEEQWNLMRAAQTSYDKPVDVQSYLQIETTRKLNELEVEKKRAFNEADLDNELAMMREQVRLAIIAKHFSDHQMISLIGEQLDGLYQQVEQIKSSATPYAAKVRMIEDREEYISTLKEDRRGRQQRLLEARNGGDIRADNENTYI